MKKLPYVCIISGAALWGLIGLFVRYLTAAGFDQMQLVTLRAYISAAALAIFLFVKDRSKLKIRLRDIWYFAGTGIASFVFFNYCYFTAIGETSLSVAAILLYTAPIFVMLFSLFLFKEKMTRQKIIALALAFLGCVLVSGVGGGQAITGSGFFFGIMSGFLYSLYSIFGRYALKRYDSITVTAYSFIFASIGVTPLADVGGIPRIVNGDFTIVAVILLFVLVTSILPYTLYTRGLKDVEPSKASIMACVEPVVATLVGVFAFGEALSPGNVAGILAVVGALAVLNSPAGRRRATHSGKLR